MAVIVDSLGGGGNNGLAAELVEAYRLQDRVEAVISFANCVADGGRGIDKQVAWAFVEVELGINLDRRVFEDKPLIRIVRSAPRTASCGRGVVSACPSASGAHHSY